MLPRMFTRRKFTAGLTFIAVLLPLTSIAVAGSVESALTFYAPFDGTAAAAFAKGDPQFYRAASMAARSNAVAGLPPDGPVKLARGEGRFGDALHFTQKQSPFVFFKGAGNVAYAESNWSGTVSFWLKTDPEKDLAPGFCDPIQITPRAWNDAAFFVEFEKRKESIPFRLGVYADFKIWNPENREWKAIRDIEKPLVTVDPTPFQGGRWTHIVFTWQNFNSGASNGVARLYLDGEFRGELAPRTQTFTWDADKNAIALGLSYIGLFDELAIFNRALAAHEITALHRLDNGVRALVGKR